MNSTRILDRLCRCMPIPVKIMRKKNSKKYEDKERKNISDKNNYYNNSQEMNWLENILNISNINNK